MRINGFRCDGCGKEQLFDPSFVGVDAFFSLMPEGWIAVMEGKPANGKEPLVFCSTLCLHRWTGKSLTSVNEQPEEVKRD